MLRIEIAEYARKGLGSAVPWQVWEESAGAAGDLAMISWAEGQLELTRAFVTFTAKRR